MIFLSDIIVKKLMGLAIFVNDDHIDNNDDNEPKITF